jgi:hypothetical protein
MGGGAGLSEGVEGLARTPARSEDPSGGQEGDG